MGGGKACREEGDALSFGERSAPSTAAAGGGVDADARDDPP
jgi:hypothetical protein